MSEYLDAPSADFLVEHWPVLLQEALDGLRLCANATVIDGTLGGGGHTAKILAAIAPRGVVLGLDADPEAIARVRVRFPEEVSQGRLIPVQAPFEQMEEIANRLALPPVRAILLDLGVSSYQLDYGERGFSFQREGPLDMRFDPEQGISAADIINTWDEKDLADLIYRYGEEHYSRRIARAIVRQRPIQTTSALAATIETALGGRKGSRTHPATRTFQALRIVVNRELEQLEHVLPQCLRLLEAQGRLAVISFHSMEDRIIKRWMQQESSDFVQVPSHPQGGYARRPTLKTINRKPIEASESEVHANPRSRSAKLRIAEKL